MHAEGRKERAKLDNFSEDRPPHISLYGSISMT